MAENKPFISHFFSWDKVADELVPQVFAEFKANGINDLVLCDTWSERLLKEPQFFTRLKYWKLQQDIRLRETHAPFGECFDLGCLTKARRPSMINDHITCMRYAAELGSLTYTIHIGAWDSVIYHTPNDVIRPLAIETLEKLLPEAEKLGIIIAVENSFERSNTPVEVMYYVNHFNHPNIGCCYDAGHASYMENFPGKSQDKYTSHMRSAWSGYVEEFNDAFEYLAPAIVTCHLHDNDGYSDAHNLPGTGRIDWKALTEKLLTQAPRLCSIQSEVSTMNHAIPVKRLCDKFRELFPEL